MATTSNPDDALLEILRRGAGRGTSKAIRTADLAVLIEEGSVAPCIRHGVSTWEIAEGCLRNPKREGPQR